MANISVEVIDSNNINVEVTPQAPTVITIDKGVSGVGISNVSIVDESGTYYLQFTYTNGTTELVPLPAISSGVVSFNTRIGVVTLEFSDVTGALGYTPPTPTGTGATGTWNISILGNAATVTNGVVTTGSYSDPSWITALSGAKVTSIPNSSLQNSSITINGNSVSLGASTTVTADTPNSLSAGTGLSGGSFNGSATTTFSISNTAVTAGSYGSASNTLEATVNAQGQLTALASVPISISPSQINATIPNSGLTNSAITINGDSVSLGGSVTVTADLPNPLTAGTGLSGGSFDGSVAKTFAIANTTVTSGSYGSASNTLEATVNAQGQLTALSAVPISISSSQINTAIPNTGLVNSSITINGNSVSLGSSTTVTADTPNALTIGTGLGGTSFNGSSPVTIAINSTGVTAGSYGSASTVPTYTVNAQGQLTSASNTTISISPSQINATIPNSGLTNSSVTINGGTVSLGGSETITAVNPYALTIGTGLSGISYNGSSAVTVAIANSGVTAGSYGSSAVIPVLTVNSQGQITSISTQATNAPAYQGTWNANTNSPTITSSVGTAGYYYVVNVAGNTTINGVSGWNIGDWIIFQNGVWDKIPGSTTESFTTVTTTNLGIGGLTGYVYANNTSGLATASTTIPTTALSGTITNAQLANSTISGISLGSNLNALTIGTGLSGTSYNGSSAITINNTAPMVYPNAGIPNSTGSAWGTSYSTTGSGTVVALATGASLTNPTQSSYETWTTITEPTYSAGRMWYDNTQDAIGFFDSISGNDIFLGREVQERAYNNTGSTIPVGSVVYINGQHSQFPTVALAQANSSSTCNAWGVTNTAIANNSYGDVVVLGKFTGLNTSAFNSGDLIYLSATTAGGLTNVAPTGSNYVVPIGYCVYSNPSQGVISITVPLPPQSFSSIYGILPVAQGGTGLSSTPTNGQIDIGNGTGFTRSTLTAGTGISVTNSSGGITITNTSPSSGGTVTSITAGTGLSGGTITSSGTIALANTAVTAGSYTNSSITVDAQGRITSASSGTAPVTSVGATLPIASSGGTTPTISISQAGTSTNGYLSSTDWNTFNNKQPSGTYVTSVTGTAPVVSSGGTTPVISMPVATSSANGYLASTDWTTFNNKSPAAGSTSITTLGTITTGTWNGSVISASYGGTGEAGTLTGILYGNGTSAHTVATTAQLLSGIGTLPVANGGTGLSSLTAGYIPYGNGTGALSSSSNLYFSGTNLGIGTSSPSAQLTVANDASISGLTVGKGGGAVGTNTAVGYGAIGSSNTGGYHSVFGDLALYVNTSGIANSAFGYASLFANTTGSTNSAFGNQTLYSNTTGSNNVAIGPQALQANTTASNNTAVGYQAGYSNTTGNLDAFGYYALRVNTTGVLNAAFGTQALQSNTTANFNSAFGANALGTNSTGGSNTAIGYGSLQSNTTASNNTAVGYQAGYSNTTQGYNTFIGEQAGYSFNGSSGQNTAIGASSGYSLTTGHGNTFIGGGDAGVYGSGFFVTTGSQNTILGNFNGNQGGLDIRTASNYIVLSDGAGNPRGIFDNSGNLLVGTTSNSVGGVSTKVGFNGDFSGSYGLSINSTVGSGNAYQINFGFGGSQKGYIFSSGGGTTYATVSDYRLKENVQPMTGALATVAQLNPVTYDWIADKSKGQGFIAHELQAVVPDCVNGEKDAVDAEGKPVYQGIDTSFLVATLTAAIQEQQALITALQTQVTALQNKVGA